MDKINALNLCEEYLYQVWCMENIEDSLCNLLKIDHAKSKDILSYLDEKIGFDFSKTPSESDLKYYADKLLNLLIEEKEKGNI